MQYEFRVKNKKEIIKKWSFILKSFFLLSGEPFPDVAWRAAPDRAERSRGKPQERACVFPEFKGTKTRDR